MMYVKVSLEGMYPFVLNSWVLIRTHRLALSQLLLELEFYNYFVIVYFLSPKISDCKNIGPSFVTFNFFIIYAS